MSVPDDVPRSPTDPSALVGAGALAALQPQLYPAGALLFRAGEPDDVLYIVLSGEIGLTWGDGATHTRPARVLGADAIIGDKAVLSRTIVPHQYSGHALTDVQVLAVPRDQTDDLLRHEPLLAYRLLHIAGEHIHRAHRRVMREMEAKNAQLERAYDSLRAAQAQLIEHERLQHELQLARELQEQMLPDALPQLEGIDLGARIIAAREVSGDFFDLFLISDATLVIVIGDVCGKGLPAALYMAQSRSLLRAVAGLPEPPEVLLRMVNDLLHTMNSGTMFVTSILARFDTGARELQLARAGHEYPLLYGADGGLRPLPRAVGQPLGMLENPQIDGQRLTLAPGETLLLYTDGVTDATDAGGEFFGIERLHAAVRGALALKAQGICDHVVERLAAFQGASLQADDITLVAIRAS